MSDTIQSAYTEHVLAIRSLGEILTDAVAARYETPPGGARSSTDTTADIVLDPSRWALSQEVAVTADALRVATLTIRAHERALSAALDAWSGALRYGVNNVNST